MGTRLEGGEKDNPKLILNHNLYRTTAEHQLEPRKVN